MTTSRERKNQMRAATNAPHSDAQSPSGPAASRSPNEAAVPLAFEDLAPHVLVVRPARPALTYDRME